MHDYIHLPLLKSVNMYAVGLSISELSLHTSQKKTLNIPHTFIFVSISQHGDGEIHMHELETGGTTLAQWYVWHPVLVK